MGRKFIEEYFPIKEVSLECQNEQNTRKQSLADIHMWWARRPLSASRSSIYASLIPVPTKKNIFLQKEFIKKLSNIESFLDLNLIGDAKKKIKNFNNSLKILDPFSGGGSIPFESLNLGCDVYACDYNPVAVTILKSILDFPFTNSNVTKNNKTIKNIKTQILIDLEKYSNYICEQSKLELESFYSSNDENNQELGYIWAHQIQCPNLKCKKPIPLIKQFWLSRKNNRKIAFYPETKSELTFKIIGDGYEKIPNHFDPSKGTIKRGIAECLFCKSVIDGKEVKKSFTTKNVKEKLIVIVSKQGKEKKYRIANENDYKKIVNVNQNLQRKIVKLKKEWGINPVPDEPVPPKESHRSVGSQLPLYGIETFGELFNSRQLLTNIVFTEKIRDSYDEMINQGYSETYSRGIITYLGLSLSKHSSYNAKLCWWEPTGERVFNVFGRQTFAMVYDYSEQNPFGTLTGNIQKILNNTKLILNKILDTEITNSAKVFQHSATSLDFEDDYFDAVFTDPPYYDNIPYSYLSDFFYVWLKRSIGFIDTVHFSTPLTPKTDEIVAYSNNVEKITGKDYFEKLLKKSFIEIHRVLKTNGVGYVVYSHKSTEGWETLIAAMLEAGLVITASWPIKTEMSTRLVANETASLNSSIYMIIRKWKKEEVGFYRDIKKELQKYLEKKLEQLWNEGISGADFFISAIGSAIEVYGKYEKVIDDNDEQISVLKLLNDTRKIVTDYAINKVIKGEFSDEISQMTRFYILWRWAYGEAKVPFDDALRMAQSVGIDIEHEWNKGFIVKEKEFIMVLGPDERNDDLNDPQDLIDILHKTLQIWKKGKINEVDKFLEQNGYKNSEVFKRVAQAISESLSIESTEKKWLDGFLTGFKSENSSETSQSKLF